MATSLQRYVTARQAQRAKPVPPPPPARRTTQAQPLAPVTRVQPRNTMAPPVRQPAVNTMAPPVPRPIQQQVTAPPTGMAQQAPVMAPGQMAPAPAQGQTAPPPPPSLFKQPLAPEFSAPAPEKINYPGQNFGPSDLSLPVPQQQMPQPDQNPYGGMSPADALGGGLTQQQPDGTRKGQTQQMPQPQQQPQLSQLLSIMPPDYAAQITPTQLAALTPDQIGQMIVKFSQPQSPMMVGHGDELINPRGSAADSSSSNIRDYMGKGQVYGLGRSNPLSM